MQKTILTELDLDELRAFCTAIEEKPYRAEQLALWLYRKGITNFDQMTNIPKATRQLLTTKATCLQSQVISSPRSSDGTIKPLIRLADDSLIETVIIPDSRRITLCISTQVGCPIRCIFCASGKQGFKRNLTKGEMVEQYLLASLLLACEDAPPYPASHSRRITSIVFMGMGEPLLNYENLRRTLLVFNAPWAFNISPRRITVSTIGILKHISALSESKIPPNLAISLHAATDSLRRYLIPEGKLPSVKTLTNAAALYRSRTGREVTFEYVMIKGVNSSTNDAQALAELVKNTGCKVNLIRYNPIPGIHLKSPDDEEIVAFGTILRRRGILTTVRKSRGTDIDAACGQLVLRSHCCNTGNI